MIESAHIEERAYWYVIDNATKKPLGGYWSTKEIAEVALAGDTPRAIKMEYARDKAEVPTAKNHSQVCNEITKRVAAALRNAVAEERERCAKICEAESGPGFSCRHVDHAQGFCECAAKAAAIRAPINT